MKKHRSHSLLFFVAFILLSLFIPAAQAGNTITLWDEEVNWDHPPIYHGLIDAPAELDYGNQFNSVDLKHSVYDDYPDWSYSGSAAVLFWDEFQESPTQHYDWAGIIFYSPSDELDILYPWNVYGFVSIYLNGCNTSCSIMMILYTMDHWDWEVTGMSYCVADQTEDFEGWQKITFNLADFQAYPEYEAADFNDITGIALLYNSQETFYGTYEYRIMDLIQTAEKPAQQTISDDLILAASLMASIWFIFFITTIFVMAQEGCSGDHILKVGMGYLVLLIILLVLAGVVVGL